jgi:hypothetical protein
MILFLRLALSQTSTLITRAAITTIINISTDITIHHSSISTITIIIIITNTIISTITNPLLFVATPS